MVDEFGDCCFAEERTWGGGYKQSLQVCKKLSHNIGVYHSRRQNSLLFLQVINYDL